MNDSESISQAEEFNSLLRQAYALNSNELGQFLENIDDLNIRNKIDFLVRTGDENTIELFKTGMAGQIDLVQNENQLLPGEKVGRFRVEKILAQGGMGLVYLGFDELLGRFVAIKSIRPDFAFNPKTHKRFFREAQILSQINDRRICQIYDFITQNECEYLVLEFIEGKNLNDRSLQLKVNEYLILLSQLAGALEKAHNKGIIHRDLKPENLMVIHGCNLKILDFGIAHSAQASDKIPSDDACNDHSIKDSRLTQEGGLMGTLRYMSPEQAKGLELTTSSDMYTVGVIMQELLTQKNAYDLDDDIDLKNHVSEAKLIQTDGMGRKYREIITSLTHLQPEKRISAAELNHSIQNIIKKPQPLNQKFKFALLILFMVFLLGAWYLNSRASTMKFDLDVTGINQSDEINNFIKTRSRKPFF